MVTPQFVGFCYDCAIRLHSELNPVALRLVPHIPFFDLLVLFLAINLAWPEQLRSTEVVLAWKCTEVVLVMLGIWGQPVFLVLFEEQVLHITDRLM